MSQPSAKDKIIKYLLTPLSYLYGGVTWVRNKLFDSGILSEYSYDVPVVGVGNITVGGTGKTPHVEYIVDMLSPSFRIAVLSRGYKRKTHGFIIASATSTPEQIGDEPMQIYRKLHNRCKVCVCENRKKGIEAILDNFPDTDLILLDDSFQHRWVKPKISIVLVDYNRPITSDHLLPLGRLRESSSQIYRADQIIVTKCPDQISPLDYRLKTKETNLMPFQKLYFSTYEYGDLTPVFSDDSPYSASLAALSDRDSALIVTGIANPRPFIRHFKNHPLHVEVAHFEDHHDFSKGDLKKIAGRFHNMKGMKKLIITTEKDAVRLIYNPYFPQDLKPYVFYIPVYVKMLPGLDGDDFITNLKNAIDRN